MKTVVVAAVFGIIGVLAGSIATGFFNLYAEKEKRRLESTLST